MWGLTRSWNRPPQTQIGALEAVIEEVTIVAFKVVTDKDSVEEEAVLPVVEEAVVPVVEAAKVASINHIYDVLGVAGVRHSLLAHGLVGVTTTSYRERLVYLPALDLLLGLLDYAILKGVEVFISVEEEAALVVIAEEDALLQVKLPD